MIANILIKQTAWLWFGNKQVVFAKHYSNAHSNCCEDASCRQLVLIIGHTQPSLTTMGKTLFRVVMAYHKFDFSLIFALAFVAVLDRNRILFHCVFRAHHQVRRTIALSFRLGWGSYALCGRIRHSCVYVAHMSLTLSGSSALQRVKLGDALEIRNGIIFNFYSGLPHLYFEQVLKTKYMF